MTKTLTEQWRDGTLPLNHYYVKTKSGRYGIDNTVLTFDEEKPITKLSYSDYTEEVIAPVPSYNEVKEMSQKIERLEFDNDALEISRDELKKKLDIATNALKKYQEAINRFKKDPMNNIIMLAHQLIYDIDIDSKKTLKEMERVR